MVKILSEISKIDGINTSFLFQQNIEHYLNEIVIHLLKICLAIFSDVRHFNGIMTGKFENESSKTNKYR